MGRKLPSSFGEEPGGQLSRVLLLKGVSLAHLHGPHNTSLCAWSPHRQQPLTKAAHIHTFPLVFMHMHISIQVQASSLT